MLWHLLNTRKSNFFRDTHTYLTLRNLIGTTSFKNSEKCLEIEYNVTPIKQYPYKIIWIFNNLPWLRQLRRLYKIAIKMV